MQWKGVLISVSLCSQLFTAGGAPVQAATKSSGASSQAANTASSGDKSEAAVLEEIQRTLGKSPIDAHVDRVWHAVPGLCGWALDIPASSAKSKRINDGALHLVWTSVPPAKRLTDLPAEPIYRGPANEKSAALMFNVAWGEEDIPSILSTLDKYHVKGTFFLDGDWVKKHGDLAKKIAEDGQAIGSHGTGHPDFRRLGDSALGKQITGTNERIEHTIGRKIDLIAPPAGAFDGRVVRMAKQHDMYTVLWTVDTIDWNRPAASVIVKRVLSRMEPGSLVLMHPTPSTAAALPVVIERLQEQGYRLKTVEDVVHEQPAAHPPQTLRRQP
ncbi:polysaccharide deacetylase family protein [Alicyclobacillus ferrooxydans]|uniref:NodB homology domain-containing protein n=1 Tax=Alicyclobacillus ferrooxydans TaxID=471514 RepID=A0A0P9C4U7_9BACL|nr:polysaccharide deacetylase family protein [Alicyclobacillus ferrooxydans]KPV39836.1 hypothetical protein AN477_22370 [Alicyclobacillus ferrooxydans]